jgi:hypothetical protein
MVEGGRHRADVESQLAVLAAKYASVANRDARAAMVEYAAKKYGCDPELAQRGIFVAEPSDPKARYKAG